MSRIRAWKVFALSAAWEERGSALGDSERFRKQLVGAGPVRTSYRFWANAANSPPGLSVRPTNRNRSPGGFGMLLFARSEGRPPTHHDRGSLAVATADGRRE